MESKKQNIILQNLGNTNILFTLMDLFKNTKLMFSKLTTKEEMIVDLYQDQYTHDEIFLINLC